MNVSQPLQPLGFTLPTFTRIAWVSDTAKAVWEPRLQWLAEKHLQVKLRMLQDGHFACTVQQMPAWKYLKIKQVLQPLGLHHTILKTINAYEPGKLNIGFVKPISFQVVIGTKTNVTLFEDAYRAGDIVSTAYMLGIPDCCRNFYYEKRIQQKWSDLSWFRMMNSSPAIDGDVASVSFLPQLNTFWKPAGIGAMVYQPCSFHCSMAEKSGSAYFDTCHTMSYHEQASWLHNILLWPLEWSAVHGIAEIKTPVLRISTNTDAVAQKLVAHMQSEFYPEEGARGLHFPFRQPGFKRVTDSTAFQMGLKNSIAVIND